MLGQMSVDPQINFDPTYLNDNEDNKYRHAKHYIKEAQDLIKATKMEGTNVEIGVKTAWKEIKDIENWTLGLADLDRTLGLSNILKREENGEELSKEDRTLLDALALNMAVNDFYSEDLRPGHTWGR